MRDFFCFSVGLTAGAVLVKFHGEGALFGAALSAWGAFALVVAGFIIAGAYDLLAATFERLSDYLRDRYPKFEPPLARPKTRPRRAS